LKFTTYSRYAIRAMLILSQDHPVSLREISQREKIPEKFLEQIFIKLKTKGLVKGKRGVRGGYVLAKDPSQITWLEIMEAVEESLLPVPCLEEHGEKECPTFNECVVRQYWRKFYDLLREYFSSLTLAKVKRDETHTLSDSKRTFRR